MEFISSRSLASDVTLVEKSNKHSGPPARRRSKILQRCVKLNMRRGGTGTRRLIGPLEIPACRNRQTQSIVRCPGQDFR